MRYVCLSARFGGPEITTDGGWDGCIIFVRPKRKTHGMLDVTEKNSAEKEFGGKVGRRNMPKRRGEQGGNNVNIDQARARSHMGELRGATYHVRALDLAGKNRVSDAEAFLQT